MMLPDCLQTALTRAGVLALSLILGSGLATAHEPTRDSDDFVVHNDGTVTDQRLNLMWAACTTGQQWQQGSCVGEPMRLSWSGGRHAARDSSLGGHDDWRLPTIRELRDLVHCSSGRRQGPDNTDGGYRCGGAFQSPTILQEVFPDTPEEMFWSYSPSQFLSFGSMGVFFRSGGSFHRDREDLYLVRMVRDLD